MTLLVGSKFATHVVGVSCPRSTVTAKAKAKAKSVVLSACITCARHGLLCEVMV